MTKHLKEKGLTVKALLVLDNAPTHPNAASLVSQGGNIKAMFLPPNTTAVQPKTEVLKTDRRCAHSSTHWTQKLDLDEWTWMIDYTVRHHSFYGNRVFEHNAVSCHCTTYRGLVYKFYHQRTMSKHHQMRTCLYRFLSHPSSTARVTEIQLLCSSYGSSCVHNHDMHVETHVVIVWTA